MTESLHKIVEHYLHHWTADDLCNDITGWLQRNYDPRNNPLIDEICEDIWKSCEEGRRMTNNLPEPDDARVLYELADELEAL